MFSHYVVFISSALCCPHFPQKCFCDNLRNWSGHRGKKVGRDELFMAGIITCSLRH